MENKKIIQRYSNTFFELIKNENNRQDIKEELLVLIQLFDQFPQLQKFIDSGKKEREKKALLNKILLKCNPIIKDFVFFLAYKKRLAFLTDILQLTISHFNKQENIVHLTCLAPYPINDEIKNLIQKKLNSYPKFKEKTIKISIQQDPTLIAGIKIIDNDYIYDFSISSMLKQFKQNLMN